MSKTNNKGFIKAIIVIVIAFAILAYWGYDIKRILSSPEFKEKLVFIWNWARDLWTNYIVIWAKWLWHHGGESLYTSIKGFLPSANTGTATSTPEI
jgi:hypothetical protein